MKLKPDPIGDRPPTSTLIASTCVLRWDRLEVTEGCTELNAGYVRTHHNLQSVAELLLRKKYNYYCVQYIYDFELFDYIKNADFKWIM